MDNDYSGEDALVDQTRDMIKALNHMRQIAGGLDQIVDENLPYQIADIVKFHSKGAAAAAVGSAWIPGAGGAAAILASAGFIWSMYARIGSEINLPMSENILKTLGSGVATNLASGMAASWVMSSVFSLFPGIGSIGASVVMGGTCYALTLASGYVYLKIMTALFISGVDPTKMSEQELNNMAKNIANDSDVKDVMNTAKQAYKPK
ncbi:MAG: hypothetical protein LW832_10690 [Parachlamydia sp.]|jgi:hypothetical protein|nr:hypothetical protein [Parachlamydia sp.]